MLCSNIAMAHPHYYYGTYRHYGYAHCSNHIYLIKSDYNETETSFANCDSHFLRSKTTTNYYSNGTKRSFTDYTILNEKGETIIENCAFVKHLHHKKAHYFIIQKGKYFYIINSKGDTISTKNYRSIYELATNRFLVKLEKLYGIIDIKENTIVPTIYTQLKPLSAKTFLTKLNGYYGILDINGNIILKNKYDKISPLQDVLLVKYKKNYGLYTKNGELIVDITNDNIKELGNYIIVKKDKLYKIYNTKGELLTNETYKKVKLERNTLKVYTRDKTWKYLENIQ